MQPRPRPPWMALVALSLAACALGGCAELLGIESWQERYPEAGEGAGGAGGTNPGGGGQGGDGVAGQSPAEPWSLRIGGPSTDIGRDVAVAPNGDVLLAGEFRESIKIETETLDGGPGPEALAVRFGGDGAYQWSAHMGGNGEQRARAVAVRSTGEVVVAGHFDGSMRIDGKPHDALTLNIFVAELDGATGSANWSESFGGSGSQKAVGMALDRRAGNEGIVLAGQFGQELTHPPLDPLTAFDGLDAFVMKLATDGSGVWSRRFGEALDQAFAAVDVDGGGNIVVAGFLQGDALIGSQSLSVTSARDVLVAKLDPSGDAIWGRQFGQIGGQDPAAQEAHDVAADAAGDIYVAGYFKGSIHFSSTYEFHAGGSQGADGFVAKLAGGSGAPLWASRFSAPDLDLVAHTLAVGADGSAFVAGRFQGEVDFGGGVITCLGAASLFWVRFAGDDGAYLNGGCFDGSSEVVPTGLAVTDDDGLVLGGEFLGQLDLGQELLDSAGDEDIFLMKMFPL